MFRTRDQRRSAESGASGMIQNQRLGAGGVHKQIKEFELPALAFTGRSVVTMHAHSCLTDWQQRYESLPLRSRNWE